MSTVPSSAMVYRASKREIFQERANDGAASNSSAAIKKPQRIRLGFRSIEDGIQFIVSVLELHGWHSALRGIGNLKELPLLEVEHAGNEVGRERLNLRIQVANHGVVVTA